MADNAVKWTRAKVITPSDSAEVNCSAVYVGGTGNLTVIMRDDTATTLFSTIPAGTVLEIACAKIMSTGTTATTIVGLF